MSAPQLLVRSAVTRRVVLFSVLGASSATLALAQEATSPNPPRRRGAADGNEPGGERRAMNPQEMQARMLANLRERFGVTSDEEWTVISERLTKLVEVRRTMPGAAGGPGAMLSGFRGPSGPAAGPEGGNRGTRGAVRPGGSPESEALQAAVTDKLPEAEIKARLDKLRETRKANAQKLEQAQEDFRAVLSVRQEAIAVLVGLLP